MNPATIHDPQSLRTAWAALREQEHELRTRNAAARLGVSEAELIATRCGSGVRRISADVARFLPRLEELGELMALTRNDVFVHEKVGVYRNVTVTPHAAQVVDSDIDLRIFPGEWHHGFAVENESSKDARKSLQFFDRHGTAVHKIYFRDESRLEAYEALVADLLSGDQAPGQIVEPPPVLGQARPDADIDVPKLEQDWRAMRDTHDFFHLLRQHGVTRLQALRVVSDDLARLSANDRLRAVLSGAAADGVDIMVFVRSRGTYQIHHGPVKRIVDTGPWLNVLDPGFSLHVREGEIASSWIVYKPTETGWVTSLELYDDKDDLLALLFGCRQEGQPENPEWRALLD